MEINYINACKQFQENRAAAIEQKEKQVSELQEKANKKKEQVDQLKQKYLQELTAEAETAFKDSNAELNKIMGELSVDMDLLQELKGNKLKFKYDLNEILDEVAAYAKENSFEKEAKAFNKELEKLASMAKEAAAKHDEVSKTMQELFRCLLFTDMTDEQSKDMPTKCETVIINHVQRFIPPQIAALYELKPQILTEYYIIDNEVKHERANIGYITL